MSNGSGPGGNEEKIILNGGSAGAILVGNAYLLDEVCTRIYRYVDGGGHLKDAPKLVLLANELENEALALQEKIFAFQREYLTQRGFDGPWPHSMDTKTS